jgi:acyl carrier protein
MSLPTYPFAGRRCWVPPPGAEAAEDRPSTENGCAAEDDVADGIQGAIQRYLVRFMSKELHLGKEEICLDRDAQEYGANSIVIMKLARHLEKSFGIALTGREMMEHSTIKALSQYLGRKTDTDLPDTASNVGAVITTDTDGVTALEQFRQGVLSLEELERMLDKGEIACI